MWPFSWFKRRKIEIPKPVLGRATAVGVQAQMLSGVAGLPYAPGTGLPIRKKPLRGTVVKEQPVEQEGSGFVDGLIAGAVIGNLLHDNSPAVTPEPVAEEQKEFSGFGGGASGGAGAQGEWFEPAVVDQPPEPDALNDSPSGDDSSSSDSGGGDS